MCCWSSVAMQGKLAEQLSSDIDLENKVKVLEKSEYFVDNHSGSTSPKITFKCVMELIECTMGLFTATAHS